MQLNFEIFNFQIKEDNNGKKVIFDQIRRKYVSLTPEEWVRQHVIKQLVSNGWPASRMSVERTLPHSKKRYDIIHYNQDGKPELLIECKAPSVPITQKTVNQATGYIHLQDVPFVFLTNGLKHLFIARMGRELKIVNTIPLYSEINTLFLRAK
ncbi:type I restriction enzyme HsdR N-terminal domain-containing protein [Bacteroidia bacterium]|nr:type I restriction enzyme HsdR N-terminal domain-containing protein [Bacteroidia bacterium]